MALDRIIKWREKKPTRAELRTVFEAFFGGAATYKDEKDRLFITLPGKNTFPFRSIVERPYHPCEEHPDRWIEVWYNPSLGGIDIITRQSDEYTNVLARGMADMLVRFYEAEKKYEG